MIQSDFDGIFTHGSRPEVAQQPGYHALLRQLQSAHAALASISDAVIQTDSEGTIIRVNRAAEQMTQLPLNKLLGQTIDHVIPPARRADDETTQPRNPSVPQGVYRVLKHKALGDRKVLITTASHLHGNIYVLHGIAKDQVAPAGRDNLTGLPDRLALETALSNTLLLVDGRSYQLAYIDLDQFKVVNDLCGHRAGDELLRQLTSLWKGCLAPDELLARLGGDEFCVVLARKSLAAAQAVTEHIIDITDRFKFEWQGQSFRIGASAGLVQIDSNLDVDTLLAAADSACWAAKDNGRNRCHVFALDDKDFQERQVQMEWLARINRALDEGRMRLYHQRIVPLTEAGMQTYSEILLRLVDESGAVISPGEFVPAAERFNLMPRIDRWVIDSVFEQLARNRRQPGAHVPGMVAINLSGTSFNDPRFIQWVRDQIIEYGIPVGSVGFELTETAAISNIDCVKEFIAEMRELGCSVALDDFGSGVSSFAYLKTLSVDYIKIDGVFVSSICRNAVDRSMVEAINQVAKVIGIPTVAEFVENENIAKVLKSIGVAYGQGYHLHKPEPWQAGRLFAVDRRTVDRRAG